jgi:hypothetical protein
MAMVIIKRKLGPSFIVYGRLSLEPSGFPKVNFSES